MRLNFFDMLEVRADGGGAGIDRYVAAELAQFISAAPTVPDTPTIKIKYDDQLLIRCLSPTKTVGGVLFTNGDATYAADSAGHLVEWSIPTAESCTIHVHPNFNPYRFLFYVLIPRLKAALNTHGITFLHASAVGHEGSGIVMSGWGGTGKTNTLIRFLAHGYSYLADDLAIVGANGGVYPFPRRLNVFDYNLAVFPELARTVSIRKKAKALIGRGLAQVATPLLPGFREKIAVFRKVSSQVAIDPHNVWNLPAATTVYQATVALMYGGSNSAVTTASADMILNALVANLRFELAPIQQLAGMYAFAHGSPEIQIVGPTDEEILRRFVATSTSRVVSIAPGEDAFNTLRTLESQ